MSLSEVYTRQDVSNALREYNLFARMFSENYVETVAKLRNELNDLVRSLEQLCQHLTELQTTISLLLQVEVIDGWYASTGRSWLDTEEHRQTVLEALALEGSINTIITELTAASAVMPRDAAYVQICAADDLKDTLEQILAWKQKHVTGSFSFTDKPSELSKLIILLKTTAGKCQDIFPVVNMHRYLARRTSAWLDISAATWWGRLWL